MAIGDCPPTRSHHHHDPKTCGFWWCPDPCSHRHTKKATPKIPRHPGPCVPVRGVCSNATQPTAPPSKSQPGTRRLVVEIRKNPGFHFRGFRENSADVFRVVMFWYGLKINFQFASKIFLMWLWIALTVCTALSTCGLGHAARADDIVNNVYTTLSGASPCVRLLTASNPVGCSSTLCCVYAFGF